MVDRSSNASGGFLGILTIVFITLKLTGVISWSWWLVLLPLWMPLLLIGVFLVVLFIWIATTNTNPFN